MKETLAAAVDREHAAKVEWLRERQSLATLVHRELKRLKWSLAELAEAVESVEEVKMHRHETR